MRLLESKLIIYKLQAAINAPELEEIISSYVASTDLSRIDQDYKCCDKQLDSDT